MSSHFSEHKSVSFVWILPGAFLVIIQECLLSNLGLEVNQPILMRLTQINRLLSNNNYLDFTPPSNLFVTLDILTIALGVGSIFVPIFLTLLAILARLLRLFLLEQYLDLVFVFVTDPIRRILFTCAYSGIIINYTTQVLLLSLATFAN